MEKSIQPQFPSLSDDAYLIGLITRIKQDCVGKSIFEKCIQIKGIDTFTMASSEL